MKSCLSCKITHWKVSHYQKNDRCPPPPQTLPERACEVPSCRSDSECERHKRCCYNGCIYACLESVQPPPVLDWLVQPKPRWLGGNGWLLDGPEEVLQAEACSTTEDGDEPLHCPTGYECHIINPGNTAEGIPNRGQCIKLRGNPGQLTGKLPSFLILSCKHQLRDAAVTDFEGGLVVHLLSWASWFSWAAQGPRAV
ncbi:WAP four-disulfide core domain protein 1 isoform X3 [Strix uralensis]|uniref:WAP four-disulfide core domain protein 1 isoform X3 n=1 Tax=Strix uralensis TaxID=36305 RepID=UPI003DA5D6B5